MLLRDATTKAISLLCNVTGRCWWRVYHHAVLQLPQPPRPLRDWIVVYVLHRNSIYFLLSFWSDATKKNHIFQLSPRFPFHFPDDDQNYRHTYEKRSNEISNVRTFGASVRRLLFSHFCVVLWLVLRKKLRLVHLILKKPRRTRDSCKERLWASRETWQGAFVLVFHQSFPFFVYLSQPA